MTEPSWSYWDHPNYHERKLRELREHAQRELCEHVQRELKKKQHIADLARIREQAKTYSIEAIQAIIEHVRQLDNLWNIVGPEELSRRKQING